MILNSILINIPLKLIINGEKYLDFDVIFCSLLNAVIVTAMQNMQVPAYRLTSHRLLFFWL